MLHIFGNLYKTEGINMKIPYLTSTWVPQATSAWERGERKLHPGEWGLGYLCELPDGVGYLK